MERLSRLNGRQAELSVKSDSRKKTIDIGKIFGGFLPAGSVISLEGGLGVGKTLFVRGICAGLEDKEEVLSPTFILLEEYNGLFPILHFDLYRLEKLEEVHKLGLFDLADGRNIILVEWGDRLPEGVLKYDIRVDIQIVSNSERIINFKVPENLAVALMQENIEGNTFNNGSGQFSS